MPSSRIWPASGVLVWLLIAAPIGVAGVILPAQNNGAFGYVAELAQDNTATPLGERRHRRIDLGKRYRLGERGPKSSGRRRQSGHVSGFHHLRL